MTDGIGLGLSRRFYEQIVAPLLHERFPGLPHAAARIGLGSEVLGYDTVLSADHDYGPCVQLFLPEAGFPSIAPTVLRAFDQSLPATFEGYPTRYPTAVRPEGGSAAEGLLGSDHGVELYTLKAWCDRFLGRQFPTTPTTRDWLAYPEQFFLTVTAGAVFHDGIGELTDLRLRLAYFPRDVWLYKLAAQWGRIAQERAYVGRSGDVGDELGSRIIAARMVDNIMRLCMLLERRYAPYPKWFGTAFAELSCALLLSPLLDRALSAGNWQHREAALLDACRLVAELQCEKAVPGASAPTVVPLHDRPYRFIDSVRISDALRDAIDDEGLRRLPEFGAADQFIASNFVLAVPTFSSAVVDGLLATQTT